MIFKWTEMRCIMKNCKNIKEKISLFFQSTYVKLTILSFFIVFSFWAGAVVSAHCFGFYVNEKDIIITFIGILATFVVINNYAQIEQSRRVFTEEVRKIEEYKNEEFVRMIEKFNAYIKKLETESLKTGKNPEISRESQNLAEFLWDNYEKNPKLKYSVVTSDKLGEQGKLLSATCRIVDGVVKFYDDQNKEIKDVFIVNEYEYIEDEVNSYVKNYQ